MDPEQERMLQAYMQMLMGGGRAGADIGLDLYPTVDKKVGDTNYYQDRMQILSDPFGGFVAGPGAADYGTLMPTIERTPVDAPGLATARQWASAPEGSAMKTIYDLMVEGQMDINTAFQQVAAVAEAEPAGPIALSLPPGEMNFQTGEMVPGSNLKALYDQASAMQAGIASAPSGAMYDDATGGYYTETEVPSEMAQMFTEMGLPSPLEQYEPDQQAAFEALSREGSGYMGGMEGFGQGLSSEQAAMNTALREFSDESRYLADGGDRFLNMVGTPAGADLEPDANGNYPGLALDRAPEVTAAPLPKTGGGGGGGGWNPLEAPGAIVRSIGRIPGSFETPEGEGGGGGNPLDVLGRLFGGGGGGGESTPAVNRDVFSGKPGGQQNPNNPSDPRQVESIRRRAIQRAMQDEVFQGTRDRRKSRMKADPGGRQAISSAAMKGAGGQNRLRLSDVGQSFNTAEEAIRGARAYLDTPQSNPFNDAIRERMLFQQISGF